MAVQTGLAGRWAEAIRRWSPGRQACRWLAVGSLLMALSTVVWGLMERWQPVGGQLLHNPSFADGAEGWVIRRGPGTIELTDGGARLAKADTAGMVGIEQLVPIGEGGRAFRVEALLGVTDVKAAELRSPWQRAMIGFVGLRPDGAWDMDRPGYLARLVFTRPERLYTADLVLAGNVTEALLFIRLARVSGAMQVRDLRLVRLEPQPLYSTASRLLIPAWALFLAFAAWRFVRTAASRPPALLLVAALAAAAALSLVPYELTVPFYAMLHRPFRGLIGFEPIDFAVHVLGFALVALCWRLARPHDDARLWLGLLLATAIGGELIQGFAAGLGRDDLMDTAANVIGLAIGAGLAWLWRRRASGNEKGASRPPPV